MAVPTAKTGSVMMCDKGTAPVPLVASGKAAVSLCGALAAVVSDALTGSNISPFGACAILKSACVPLPNGKWVNPIVNSCIIGNEESLLEGATLPCTIGGIISVMSAAQATVLVGENRLAIVKSLAAYMAGEMGRNAWGLLDLLRVDAWDLGPFSIPREADQGIDLARALERFVNNVRPGGAWDYKQWLSDAYDPVSGTELKRDIWGNVHYGYVGSAMGFPTRVLKAGGNFPRRDDPRDQAAIELGAKLWRERGLGLTPEDLLEGVRDNADKLK